jgi:hypothetical protein
VAHRVAGTRPVHCYNSKLIGKTLGNAIGEARHLPTQAVNQQQGWSIALLFYMERPAWNIDETAHRFIGFYSDPAVAGSGVFHDVMVSSY